MENREKIALLFYKQPELDLIFEEKFETVLEDAIELAETYIKHEPVQIPSREDIFETEHHWEWYFKAQKHEQEQ